MKSFDCTHTCVHIFAYALRLFQFSYFCTLRSKHSLRKENFFFFFTKKDMPKKNYYIYSYIYSETQIDIFVGCVYLSIYLAIYTYIYHEYGIITYHCI